MTKQTIKGKRRICHRKMMGQRLIGLALLACCVLVLWLCHRSTVPTERDATVVLLMAPLALYMLFTKELVIY